MEVSPSLERSLQTIAMILEHGSCTLKYMISKLVSGKEGYAIEALSLLDRYEQNSFDGVYAAVREYFPVELSTVDDIGSGTGRNASYLEKMGHKVVAVEPTTELGEPARKLHTSKNIEWIDDSLPGLSRLVSR